jgi:uncharacterized repeat protein (TIGR03803 family)
MCVYNKIRLLATSRYASSIWAAALLAGCGGSQPTLSVAPGVLTTQQSIAQSAFHILHKFGGAGDGTNPSAGLIDVKGTLYGTTIKGGANGYGTVFSIATSGAETVLHDFGGSGDGAQPAAELLNVSGTLYGTTSAGGATSNAGTVFSITPSGTETVLHSFDFAGTGGAAPVAGLIDVNGTLYGTTSAGGHGAGTVFSITTGGEYNVLHYFGKDHDGSTPQAALLFFGGLFYGTTVYGGASGSGTVFSINKAGKEQVLHSFYHNNGALPTAALIAVNGTLYGTTSQGGGYYDNNGTVFRITTDGTENVLHAFSGSDGSRPLAGLKNIDGVLYGTTFKGGLHNVGTVFEITEDGKESELQNFGSGNGDNPLAGLVAVGGQLYGTTYGTSVKNNLGNVFALTP